ncbi:MAG: cytochrome c [Burkholderiaceae bacterium]
MGFATAVVLSIASSFTGAAHARGNADAGKQLVTKKYVCASCHGANFATPIDPSYPKLAGQHQDYLRQALLAYQKGDHPTFGRNNAVMGAQAKPLSAAEIDDIAAYLSGLPPSLVLKR